jgi:hypothetical protein
VRFLLTLPAAFFRFLRLFLQEDLELAKAVPGIDAIVSGHTHERYFRTVVRPSTSEEDTTSHAAPVSTHATHATHMWQCGAEGATLGVVDFELSASRGLVHVGDEGKKDGGAKKRKDGGKEGEPAPPCVEIGSLTAADLSDPDMAQRTLAWREEAGEVLGLKTMDKVVYNGTVGEGGLLSAAMTGRQVSMTMAGGILDQINRELQTHAEERAEERAEEGKGEGSIISTMLGSAAAGGGGGGVGNGGEEALRVAAYISCIDCVRSDVHEHDGRVPLLGSDVYRTMGITGGRHVSLFYMHKSAMRGAVDLTDLLYRFVSPIFGITVSPNVQVRELKRQRREDK